MSGTNRQRFLDVDDRTEELRDVVDENPGIFREFLQRFELSWIYHENALEGIVVTHAELNTALKGRPIALDTYCAIRNLKRGIDHVRSCAARNDAPVISLDFVNEIHEVLGEGVNNYEAGKYRKFIPLHRTYFHDIAQPASIAPRITRLMEWAEANDPGDEDAVSFAARLHHEFMSIFPYPKNSGKVGRLLVNYVLMRHGYVPVIFHASERQRYYDMLRHSPKEMEAFLSEMMMNCIDNAQKFIVREVEEREKAADRARLISNA